MQNNKNDKPQNITIVLIIRFLKTFQQFLFCLLFIITGIPVTKDHPDELQKKWICTNKQTFVSAIVAGILVCSLLTLMLVLKFNTNGYTKQTSSKLIYQNLFGH